MICPKKATQLLVSYFYSIENYDNSRGPFYSSLYCSRNAAVIILPKHQTWKKDSIAWRASLLEPQTEEVQKKNILTWRQIDSFEKAKKRYPFAKNLLIPDVALMVGPLPDTDKWSISKEKYDIIFLMRNDKESLHAKERNVAHIQNIINKLQATAWLTFHLTDWFEEKWIFFDSENSHFFGIYLNVSGAIWCDKNQTILKSPKMCLDIAKLSKDMI